MGKSGTYFNQNGAVQLVQQSCDLDSRVSFEQISVCSGHNIDHAVGGESNEGRKVSRP